MEFPIMQFSSSYFIPAVTKYVSLSAPYSRKPAVYIFPLKCLVLLSCFFVFPYFFHIIVKRPSANQYFNIRKTVATGWQRIVLQQSFLHFL